MTEQMIKLDAREQPHVLGPRPTPNSYWLNGSRARYGEAYFISLDKQTGEWWLWRNHRPYAANERIGSVEYPPTWEQIDEMVRGDEYWRSRA